MLPQFLQRKQRAIELQVGAQVIIDGKWQFTITNKCTDGSFGIHHNGHTDLFQQKLDRILKWEYQHNPTAFVRAQVFNHIYRTVGQEVQS